MRVRSARAFTLIETIVAVVVIGVATPAMLWAVREAHIDRANPVLASRARWLAVERLEEVIADRHSPLRGYDWLVAANYRDEREVDGFPGYARRVRLRETGADLATAGAGYMAVTVEVEWLDAGRVRRTLSVSTVLTEYAG
jgi:prepilin-type N-terminal cleavage/methylation domain-containing protein